MQSYSTSNIRHTNALICPPVLILHVAIRLLPLPLCLGQRPLRNLLDRILHVSVGLVPLPLLGGMVVVVVFSGIVVLVFVPVATCESALRVCLLDLPLIGAQIRE